MRRLSVLFLCLTLLWPAAGLGEDFLVTDAKEAVVDTITEGLANASVFEAGLASLNEGSYLDAVNDFTRLGSLYGADQYAGYAYALLMRMRQEPDEAIANLEGLSGFLDSDYQLALTQALRAHRCRQDGRYGYVDAAGGWTVAPQFDWAERVFREESVPAHDRADTAWEPSDLYAVAMVFAGTTQLTESDIEPLEGLYGLVRSDGTLAVPLAYTGVLWTRDGYAAVTDGETCALYDLVAAAPVGDGYEAIGEYAQGYVPVEQNGLWGYLNPATGKLLGDGCVWESAQAFSEGLAGVSLDGAYGFIDLTGQVAVGLQYAGVAPFGEGLAGVRIGKRWGFIDTENKLVIKQAYTAVRTFRYGLCAVQKSDKWGLVDTEGNVVLRVKYAEITDFDPIYHRAWFRQNKLWGLVTSGGTVVLKPTWSVRDDFEGNTLCRVAYQKMYGFIDANGKTRVVSAYEAASAFRADIAAVEDADGWITYIDKMQRGFFVPTDVPVECLCGFIEGRTFATTERTTVDENGETQTETETHLEYALYDRTGSPIAVDAYAAE